MMRSQFTAGVAVAVATVLTAASPATATGISGRSYEFDVKWSIFPELTLATGRIDLDQVEEEYQVRMEAKAQLAVPSINWRGAFATVGAGALGDGFPERFERRSIRPDLETTVVVTWDAVEETPITRTATRPDGYTIERDPVDPSEIIGVVDPLSFMAKILTQVQETNGASCDTVMRTWDGARLAEIELQTAESVVSTRLDCRVIYRSISGLRKDSPWRAEEARTDRIVRFTKTGLDWQPRWLKISGVFVGYESTFTTTITPIAR